MDQGLNWELARALNGWAGRYPVVDAVGAMVASDLVFLVLLSLLVWWFLPSADDIGKRAALATGIAVVFGQAVNMALGHLVFVPRPFVAHQVQLLVAAAHDSSFPSDHSAAALAVAISALLWKMPGRRLLLPVGILIALARVYVGAHYPADILVGAGLGTLWATVVYKLDAWLRPLYGLTIGLARRVHLA